MVDIRIDSHKVKLQVKTFKKGLMTIPLKKAEWGEDSYQLVHSGVFSFAQTNELRYADIEKENELILTVNDKNKNTRIFYFFVDGVTSTFKKDPETGKTLFDEITINAFSYPSILTRNTIEGTFEFSKGFGEIVQKVSKKYGIKTLNVKLIKKKGRIYFKKMSILEGFRRMASIENWCFYFRDKNIVFGPCKPPEDSGVTITDKDMIGGTFTK